MFQLPDLLGIASAGAVAGFAKTMVSHPLDTMKVHVQNKRPLPKNLKALYRGIAVPFVRNGIEHSSHFFFRGLVASAIHSSGMPGADNAWLVGFLAGFPQSFLNTPMDYVRLQLQLGQKVRLLSSYRGLPWVVMKEATSGMIFYGFYEGFKSMNFPGGVAGSSSALLAMTMTYPVDVLKTRVQAGETVASARGMGSFGRGLNWAVAKCLVSNFVALSVYEAMCVVLEAKQPMERAREDAAAKAAAAAKKA